MLGRAAFSSAAAALMLVVAHIGVAAGFGPYTSGTGGYDYSYPQCGIAAPKASFALVGVNAGYPFTYYNTCLGTEYGAAAKTGNASVYMNTGYDPTYTAVDGRHSTQACVDSSATVAGTSSQKAAWAVGCSEASRDIAYASSQGAASPRMWWLDVEVANSWSTTDLSLNRYTVQGIVATLRSNTTTPIGIYSTASQWSSITGGYQPAVDANWVATGASTQRRASRYCSSAGFTGAPVWLVQYVSTYDHDYAC
ncbi:MAG TPA: hypothetical protein VGG90_12830 [Candidatus Dormibacteraeota bacterium]